MSDPLGMLDVWTAQRRTAQRAGPGLWLPWHLCPASLPNLPASPRVLRLLVPMTLVPVMVMIRCAGSLMSAWMAWS